MQTPTLGILIMLLTLVAVFMATIGCILALMKDRRDLIKAILVGAAIWAGAYLLILVTVSLTSRERVLRLGEDKKFCGFYLDCHTQIAVTRVDTTRVLGTPPDQVAAAGVFYVVRLRLSSDAKAATLRFVDPELTITDQAGRSFVRSAAGERALAAAEGPPAPLDQPIGAGGSYASTVVFDLPADARGPRLQVTDGFWAERLVELFLIGDEDSIFHARTSFRLEA